MGIGTFPKYKHKMTSLYSNAAFKVDSSVSLARRQQSDQTVSGVSVL